MNLDITLKSQLYTLRALIITSIVYFGIIFYLYLHLEEYVGLVKGIFLTTFFPLYVPFHLLPVIILHINYLNHDKYKNVKVEKDKLTIDGAVYTADDIDTINIVATAPYFSGWEDVGTVSYTRHYYYIEIHLKTGEQINLSSLRYKIGKVIRENFKTVNIVKEVYLFPRIPSK